jgi:hypothetical protein
MVANKIKLMPQGDKSSYSGKQKRQAEHIEESYESRGLGSKESKRRAWATVNKMTGGGKKAVPAAARRPTRHPPERAQELVGAHEKAESKTLLKS